MQFPAPSESFAAVEVRALRGRGVEVAVYGLRREHPRHAAIVCERGLAPVQVRYAGVRRALRGLLDGMLAPRKALYLLGLVLRHVSPSRERLKSLALLPIVLRIYAGVRSGGYDVVHMFWGHYPALVGALLQRFGPSPLVSVFLGAFDLGRNYGPSAVVARNAAHVRTHAAVNLTAIEALGIPREQVDVVYRGVDLAAIDSFRRQADGRVPGHVVTVGRLIASKGTERVSRAFTLLREQVARATLTVLVDGHERAALARVASALGVDDAVRFAGHVAHDAVIATLTTAEAFVLLTSKPDERLPNVVKEPMACGAVCVVSHTPGIEELVEHKRTGFVVDAADVPRSADVLASVLAGRQGIDEIRQRARADVEARCAARTSAESLVSAWSEITTMASVCDSCT